MEFSNLGRLLQKTIFRPGSSSVCLILLLEVLNQLDTSFIMLLIFKIFNEFFFYDLSLVNFSYVLNYLPKFNCLVFLNIVLSFSGNSFSQIFAN